MQFIIDLMLLSFYAFLTLTIFAYVKRFWTMNANQAHMNKVQSETIMLEIKLPREIDKTPLAMELVLANLAQSGGLSSWYALGISGNLPATFSLELASLEGVVHFYIRTHKKFKELLSSALYAHYPGVEVVETDDYTSQFPRYEHNKPEIASMWGNGFKLSKKFMVADKKGKKKKQTFFEKYIFRDKPEDDPEDKKKELPADILPIRTYVDLGLDKQKEEMKADPLVSILEYLGSLGKGEFAGLQIIIQDESVHNDKKASALYHNPVDHKAIESTADLAKLYKTSLRTKVIKKGTLVEDDYGGPKMGPATKKADGTFNEPEQLKYLKDVIKTESETSLTYETKKLIEQVENKMSKPLLACIMRTIYVVDNKKGKFNAGHIQNCLSLTKPFNAPGFNTLSPGPVADPYDFDWQNPKKMCSSWRAEEIYDAFIEREGFHPHIGLVKFFSDNVNGDRYFFPYPGYIKRTIAMVVEAIIHPFGHPHAEGVFVMNTEELATLFHLPGLVATVPTLPRIDSRKAVAPVNLPV